MFVPRLRAAGVVVHTLDLAGAELTGDIRDPDPALLRIVGSVDLVLLAVPEPVALAAVPVVAGAMRRGALLADVLSVKTRIAEVVAAHAEGVEAISLNPMFAPSLDLAGRPVAAVSLRPGPRSRELLRLLTGWGARVVLLEAGEHDRLAAATQAATHSAVLAFWHALRDLGVDADRLCAVAPPPHLTLLALLARISSGAPEVYWDIQAANPGARAARAALRGGIDRLDDVVASGSEADFAAMLGEVRTFLGAGRAPLAELCAELFTGLRAPDAGQ